MIRHPPNPTLFPYTPLFRSEPAALDVGALRPVDGDPVRRARRHGDGDPAPAGAAVIEARAALGQRADGAARRSEEHTSELQSRQYLVFRLLLDKKNLLLLEN